MMNFTAAEVLALITFFLVVWLVVDRFKIKRDYRLLVEKIDRTMQDMAGLCSAAVNMDNRLLSNDRQLKSLLEKFTVIGNDETSVQPYQAVIQKIQDGAGEEALMSSCGLSREEARLLIRLHGGKEAFGEETD